MSTLVLVHGFWHGSWCWSEVIPHVVAAGRPAVAVDMAGHGLYARRPRWFTEQPYDSEAVATEVSPVADVSLDDAAELLTSQIKRIGGGEPVTVVAHSAAGPVLMRAAEQTPELIAHAVYLTAYMPASDVSAAAYTRIPEAADSLVTPLLRGDRPRQARCGSTWPRTTPPTGSGFTRRSTVTSIRPSPTPPPACWRPTARSASCWVPPP